MQSNERQKTNTPFRCHPLPEACSECGQAILAASAGQKEGHLTWYCGHKNTLVVAVLGELDGEPGITRWTFTGPVTESQYHEIVQDIGRQAGSLPEVTPNCRRVH